MHATKTSLKMENFLANLCRHQTGVLMLDYDGTLAPFQTDRFTAFPYRGVSRLLSLIIANHRTRVILVSGRPAREVQLLLGIIPSPEIWGAHGQERLHSDGVLETIPVTEGDKQLLEEAKFRLQAKGLADVIECKSGSVAAHWRGLPDHESERVQAIVQYAWEPLLIDGRTSLLEFDGGIELRLSGCSKERAVTTVLSEITPGIPVAYLGDDLTDEDAFAALKEKALTVLVRGEWRQTNADVWIKPPQELLQFLTDWHRNSGGQQ